MRRANPNYLSLNYHRDTTKRTLYPKKTYDTRKPYSYHLQQDIDTSMWRFYLSSHFMPVTQEYSTAITDRQKVMQPQKITRSKNAKEYKWFHKFNPEITDEHDYQWEKGYKCIGKFQEKLPNADDFQCVVGIRIINTQDFTGSRQFNADYPRPERAWNNFVHNFKPKEVMSVVYISRKDGRLCHDTYYNWCAETKLPFPEQLKHTVLENDICVIDKPMRPSLKNDRGGNTGFTDFDRCRNAKKFSWYLPFDKWGDHRNLKVFNRPHKSSYKKPKQISTYRSRRERRAK